MASRFQPLTLQVTTPLRGLRTQLLAAWPHGPQRLRAVKTITRHIKDTLPAGYHGDVSVFLSNEAKTIAEPVTQGFLYHLAQHHVVTRQIVKKYNNPALLHVHVTTAEAMDEPDEDALDNHSAGEQAPLVSRIEQIKQWQKETVKAMFQAMADTAITMEAQTSLRGAMAGLNKLAALLNKAASAHKQARQPATNAAQKTSPKTSQQSVMRDISSTLSDLRSNLSAASHNGSLKPPTKAQLALRQQLNKLDKITPLTKASLKAAPAKSVKPAAPLPSAKPASLKAAPLKTVPPKTSTAPQAKSPQLSARLSARANPPKTSAPTTARPIARITIKPLALRVATNAVSTPISTIKINVSRVTPRHISIPALIKTRIITRIAQRVASVPAQRFTASSTKTIIQKIADKPATRVITVTGKLAVTKQAIATPTRTVSRFQISRPLIAQLRITPAVIAANQVQQVNTAKAQAVAKADNTKPQTQPVTTPTKTPPVTRPAVQSLGSKIPLRVTRAPAVYAGLGIAPPIVYRAPLTYRQSVPTYTGTTPTVFTARIPQTSLTATIPIPERAGLPATASIPTPVITAKLDIPPVQPALSVTAPNPPIITPRSDTTPTLPVDIMPAPPEAGPTIIGIIAQRNKPPAKPAFVSSPEAGVPSTGAPPITPAKPNTPPQPTVNPTTTGAAPPAHNPTAPNPTAPTAPAVPPIVVTDNKLPPAPTAEPTAQPTQQQPVIKSNNPATSDTTRGEPSTAPTKDNGKPSNVVPFTQPNKNKNSPADRNPDSGTIVTLRDRVPQRSVAKAINAYVESDNRPVRAIGAGYNGVNTSYYQEFKLNGIADANKNIVTIDSKETGHALRPPENPAKVKSFILRQC